MARSRRNVRNIPGRNVNKGRRNNRRGSGLGRLIASGTKTLISSIPGIGGVLSKVADIFFKSVGLTSQHLAIGSTLVEPPKTSLAAKFDITPACILSGSSGCIVKDKHEIYSQYVDARITSCTIRVIPSGASHTRCGDWHLGLQPYLMREDIAEPDTLAPTELGIHHMMYSVSGPATKPLAIHYRPRVTDGLAFHFNKLEDSVLHVAIRYDCYARPKDLYSKEFTAEDFSCDIKISGTLETRVSNEGVTVKSYKRFVADRLKSGMYLENHNGDSWFLEKFENGFRVTKQNLDKGPFDLLAINKC